MTCENSPERQAVPRATVSRGLVQEALLPSFPDLKRNFCAWVGCAVQLWEWGVEEGRGHMGISPGVGRVLGQEWEAGEPGSGL